MACILFLLDSADLRLMPVAYTLEKCAVTNWYVDMEGVPTVKHGLVEWETSETQIFHRQEKIRKMGMTKTLEGK